MDVYQILYIYTHNIWEICRLKLCFGMFFCTRIYANLLKFCFFLKQRCINTASFTLFLRSNSSSVCGRWHERLGSEHVCEVRRGLVILWGESYYTRRSDWMLVIRRHDWRCSKTLTQKIWLFIR